MANTSLGGQSRPSVNPVLIFLLNLLAWGSCSANLALAVHGCLTRTETTSDYSNMGYVIILLVVFGVSYWAIQKLSAKHIAWEAIQKMTQKRNATIHVDDLFYVAYEWGDVHIPLTFAHVLSNQTVYTVHPTVEAGLPKGSQVSGIWKVTLADDQLQTKIIDWKVVLTAASKSPARLTTNASRDGTWIEGVVDVKYMGLFPEGPDQQQKFLRKASRNVSLKEQAARDYSVKVHDDSVELFKGNDLLKSTFYLKINEIRIPVNAGQFRKIRIGDLIRYRINLHNKQSEVDSV
jgi:hypothetical protein